MTQHSPLRFGPHEWNLAYRVALRVLRAHDQAEDAAQDALLRAYAARESFNGGAQPESWLYRIAFNTALSHLRRPFRRRYVGTDVFEVIDKGGTDRPASDGPERRAITSELAAKLQQCMRTMRAKDRLAFTERFLLGTSERELGEILGVSTNAAKQRAFRARRLVRGCMEPNSGCGQNSRAHRTDQ